MAKTSIKTGLPPGSVVYIGDKKVRQVQVEVIEYSSRSYTRRMVNKIDKNLCTPPKSGVRWINVVGLHDTALIEEIGRCFRIHPLVLEDIAHTGQRPKVDDFPGYLYVILKMIQKIPGLKNLDVEQVSLVIGKNYVLSFQEAKGDVFDAVRERIENKKGRIRQEGPDFLAYALIDSIVDHYFVLLEDIGEELEQLEAIMIDHPQNAALHRLHQVKRELIQMRRSVWPLREVVNILYRGDHPFVRQKTVMYFRDVSDHTVQVLDALETYRDIAAGLLEVYLSSVSNRMNEVMKVLTVFASIFIPLTFVVGVYGMNFKHMPELTWKWSYPLLWVMMIGITFGMLWYFRRRKWW